MRGPPYLRTTTLMSQARKMENQILFMTQPMLTTKPIGWKGHQGRWWRATIRAVIIRPPTPVHSQPARLGPVGLDSFWAAKLEG